MKSRAAAIVLAVVVPLAVLGIVITRGGGDHTPARLPIAASGGGAADAAAAELYPAGGITYVAAPGLPVLDGTARAYTITGNEDAEQVRTLADALGIHGEVTTEPEGGFTVLDGDAQLTVYPYAGGGWSYVRQSSGGGVASSGVACPEPSNGADCVVPETTIPQRPANLPSSDEAQQLVLDLLGTAGVDTASVAVTVDDLTTQMAVQVDPIVDGITTQGFGTSVTVGDGGAIEYASGTLGHPQAADEYPLIGTPTAIDLLNQGRGFVGGLPLAAAAEAADLPAAEPAIAPDDAASGSTEPGSPGSPLQPCDGTGAPTTFPCEPNTLPPDTVPSDTVPPDEPPATPTTGTIPVPPPQEITITGAERILILAPSYDGRDSFLVPGYRFTTSSGGALTVLAIDDSFLAPPPDQSDGTRSAPDVTIEPVPFPEPATDGQTDSGGLSTGG